MANSLLTPTAVTRKAQQILHGKLFLAKRVNRQYDDSFANSGGKIGSDLKIRLPNKYTIRTGKTFVGQDTSEQSVTLSVATQAGVDMTFSTAELTLSIDDFAERILEPAMAIVATSIENAIAGRYIDVYNLVGTAGTTPAAMLTILQAGALLDDYLVPRDSGRSVALSPLAMATLVDGYKGLFQKDTSIGNQYETGLITDPASGFKWGMCPVINPQVNSSGTATGITLNGAPADGATAVTVNTTTTAWSTGTVITIAGIYNVNDETKTALPTLKQFVVGSGTTATSVNVSPTIRTTGALQNCSALPTSSAAVTVVGSASGSYPQNLAFHKNWLALATADLEDVSKFGAWGAREVYDGISMRLARQYDINSDNIPARIDVLYGVKTMRAEMACRITG